MNHFFFEHLDILVKTKQVLNNQNKYFELEGFFNNKKPYSNNFFTIYFEMYSLSLPQQLKAKVLFHEKIKIFVSNFMFVPKC